MRMSAKSGVLALILSALVWHLPAYSSPVYPPGSVSFGGFNFAVTYSGETGDGNNGSVGVSGTTMTLTGPNNSPDEPSQPGGSLSLTATAIASGTVNFNWSYSLVDEPAFDIFGYLLNGGFTALAGGLIYVPPPPDVLLGTASFNVVAGDTFGFRVTATDNAFGPGVATISNFTAPVPEINGKMLPQVALLLGSLYVLFVRRRNEFRVTKKLAIA